MAVATNMTVEEMNSLLNSLGLEADVELKEEKVTSKKPITRTRITNRKTVYGETAAGVEYPIGEEYDTQTFVAGYEDVTETLMIPQINVNGGKDNDSSVKYVGNGSVSPTSSAKKGGGSSKKNEGAPKRSSTVKRYKEVDDSLDNISKEMTKMNREAD
jgi:hypothetical protein